MESPVKQGGRRGATSVAAAAVLLLVAGLVVTLIGLRGPEAPTPDAPSVTSASGPATRPSTTTAPPKSVKAEHAPTPDFGPSMSGSAPVGLSIPRIGVRANNIVDLGLADDGTIEVPQDASAPGWFTPGPSPGQLGPAVIAGHVDSTTGPAVFYRLGELRPGDRVQVARADGSTADFRVDKVETYEKKAFPTRAVYGTTRHAELRLITCSGEYDSQTGYLSNTVAYAHLV
jgi:sortase (surface protein transpeptidase)